MFKFNNISVGAIALAALANLVFVQGVKAELKTTLTIEIDGLQTQEGEVCFKLFSRSFGFPDNDQNAVMRRCVKIAEDPLKITLKDIASGSYAIAVFQDLNGDRNLNRNAAGIPTESYGFSNNPAIRQNLTRYGDCVFLLAGASRTIKIQMKYTSGK